METLGATLTDGGLFRDKALINGQWVEATGRKRFPVLDPSTGKHLVDVPEMDTADVRKAIDAASNAFVSFKRTPARSRARMLRTLNDALLAHKSDIATLIVAENGKPRAEAEAEVVYSASFLEWFSGEAERTYGLTIPAANPTSRIMTIKQPIGVVAAFCPWNLPLAMATRKLAAAIAAGCTTVLKPAGETPLSTLALGELALRCGIPPGVLNVVLALDNTAEVGEALCVDPRVRKISLTGSTRVGKLLVKQSAETLKKLSLELGGNAPALVFEDADLDKAVAAVVLSKMRNAGQTCVAANRIFVQRNIHDAFVQRLAAAFANMKVGGGADHTSVIGPLISARAVDKARAHVEQALQVGGKVAWSAPSPFVTTPFEGGYFFPPTIVTGLTDQMLIWREETFGPVAAVRTFDTDEEALALANDASVGLGGYVYTTNLGRALRMAEGIETGMVGVNTGMLSACESPFGGVKESGYGREGSAYGIEEYLTIKAVNFDVS